MKTMRHILTVLVCLVNIQTVFADELCCTLSDAASTQSNRPRLGMWVWSQAAFDSEPAREKLLAFCAEEGITHLDQHVGMENVNGERVLKNSDELKALIATARKQGVTVNALRGSPEMFFRHNHEKTLGDLRAIIAFNRNLPRASQLAGIKYDVEPYGTDEWKAGGEQRVKVMLDYLSFLQKAKALLREQAPDLELSVDVPMWWDSASFATEFGGEQKLLVHHVQDLTDYIGIMSYRPSSRQVLQVVEEELSYAAAIGKTICPALETGKLEGKESWISYYGKPEADFRQTVDELRQALSGNKAVRCIMLHHYSSLVDYLGEPDLRNEGDSD